MAGHFSAPKLYKSIANSWWVAGYALCILSACAIVNPFGKINKQPLHPIPFSHPFQIIGVNMMDLPVTKSGNWYFVVFQDFLTKFPLVPDQKTICLAKLVVEQVNHFF